jgi:hypothetical protein
MTRRLHGTEQTEDQEMAMNGSKRLWASMVTLGILAVAIAPIGRADPALASAPGCAAATAEQAKSLADELYRQGQYQRAGECYQAAGDLADANEAFVKAIRPNSDAAAKDLQRQGQTAKTLFTSVQAAFRSNH